MKFETNRYNDTDAATGAWDLVQVFLSQKRWTCKDGLGWIEMDWDGLGWIATSNA